MLVGHDLVDAPLMALGMGKFRIQPHVNDLQRQHLARHGCAEGHHVGIVVLAGEAGGHGVIEQRTADALDLVGRDGHADAGRAADDAAVTFAAGDGLRRRARKVGIVTAVLGVAAEVLIFQSVFLQISDHIIGHDHSSISWHGNQMHFFRGQV